MRKYSTFTCLFIFVAIFSSYAQIKKPVTVKVTSEKVGAMMYEIHVQMTIGKGWHVYALQAGDGPVSTSVAVHKSFEGKFVKTLLPIKEVGKKITKFEEAFDANVSYFENNVSFLLRIQSLKQLGGICVPILVEYMACNDKECLPPSEEKLCVTLK